MEVIPKVGVPPVLFGMSKEDVKRVLGEAYREDYPRLVSFFANCFRINFANGRMEFIELSWCDKQFEVKYKGVSVFHTPAEDLVNIISGERAEAETDSFMDLELDLGLWRPVLPSWYPPEAPDDEYRKGVYWQTIGVGYGHFFRDRVRKGGGSVDAG